MNKVSSTTANPNVSSDYNVDVSQVSSASGVQKSSSVQSAPSPTAQELSSQAPTLSAPSTTDYNGATNFSAMYLELIVLMCETNRESYEANQEIAQMQIQSRVADLKEAASKRMTAAIVGLCAGVISAGISIAGAGISGVSLYKNTASLSSIKSQMNAKPKVNNEIEMDTYKVNGKELKTNDSKHTTSTSKQVDNNEKFEIATVENRTAITQLVNMMTRTLGDGTNAIGSSSSGMINAKADAKQAEAEETEASRQLSVSNRQAFQDLMSKFNSILQSFLEAEIKAASAAAQA